MLFLSLIPATMFLGLAGYANVLFAVSLSSDVHAQRFWIGVAIASTLYTVTGLSTFARQWPVNRPRAIAAGSLLLLALGYDALAAYGLSRAEQARAELLASNAARSLSESVQLVTSAEQDVARYANAPTIAEALAAETRARNTREHKEAAAMLVLARERARLAGVLEDARRARDAKNLLAPDARAELLPPALVAWMPVVLVTLGALVGLFSVERPRVPAAPPRAIEQAPPVVEPVKEAEDASAALLGLYRSPPKPLRVDEAGWLRGTQREMAAQLGVKPSRLNRLLHQAAKDKAIALDTSEGTAFKPARRN